MSLFGKLGFVDSFPMVVSLSAVEIYGDFALRLYAKTNAWQYLLHGIVGYIGVVYFLIQSLRLDNVLYVNGMWDGISSVMESLAAYFILGDRLERPTQYIGLVITIIGVVLLRT